MQERRKSRRIARRVQCRIFEGRDEFAGQLMDLSAGGLAMVCQDLFADGASLRIEFAGPGVPIGVSALVWHRRAVRHKGEKAFAYGCIVEDPPQAFLDLVPEGAPPAEREVGAAPTPPPQEERVRTFRVRLRHKSSPRTKTVTLAADTFEDARSEAEQKLGDEWDVIGDAA